MQIKFEKEIDTKGATWYNVWAGNVQKLRTQNEHMAKATYNTLLANKPTLSLKKIAVIMCLCSVASFVIWLFVGLYWAAMNNCPAKLDSWLNEWLAYVVLFLGISSVLLVLSFRKEIIKFINNI